MRESFESGSAFILTSSGEVTRVGTSGSPLKPGWVLLKVMAAGVCGTDLTEYRRRVAEPGVYPDVRIGHEVSGQVVVSASPSWREGATVIIDPAFFCGKCATCQAGLTSYCPRLAILGHDFGTGGLADQVAVPASAIIEVPESLDPVAAALIEPLSCAYHAASKITGTPADRVLIFGAGMIGLGVALVLRARQYQDVTVVEPAPVRRAVAERLGFMAVDRPPSAGAPVLVEASGNADAFQDAMRLTTRGGQIVVIAQHAGGLSVQADLAFAKEIRICWSLGALRSDFHAVLDFLMANVIAPAPIADVIRPDQFSRQTFKAMAGGSIAKPVIVWPW
jgi:(R,R)-butanediol dehydrogenase/meso-butanediol dehydrogenase/diacetyl reductase